MNSQTTLFTATPHVVPCAKQCNKTTNCEVNLLSRGKGVLSFRNLQRVPFDINIGVSDAKFSLEVGNEMTTVSLSNSEGVIWSEEHVEVKLNPDTQALYWFSLDASTHTIKFGIGEVREELKLIELTLDEEWLQQVESFKFSSMLDLVELYKEPVVSEPPLKITHHEDQSNLEAFCSHIHCDALSEGCRELYNSLLGFPFQLNTPDFPDLTEAIEASIKDPNGWCHKTLEERTKDFGTKSFKQTYLRILFKSGNEKYQHIPYLIEIWPSGHYSPIHNHAQSEAVTKILHGGIEVKLFSMLSPHNNKPFSTAQFSKGDVTWLSPRYNQVHQLQNIHDGICVTMQCYVYARKDDKPSNCFDYLDASRNIQQFKPCHDATFEEFQALMSKEWNAKKATS